MCLENNKYEENFSDERPEEGNNTLPSSVYVKEQKFTVNEELNGHRLDYAVSRLLGVSRNFSQKLIKDGKVAAEPQRRIKPAIKVAIGDSISVIVPPPETLELEPEDVPFEVVYSDNDIIIVNKPAGLVVHPAPGHWTGTLVHGLLYRFPDIGELNGVRRPGIVHRLDATTSGLMVVARNGLAQEGLFRDFKARRITKEYIALCYGKPPKTAGSVKFPIDRDPYNRHRMACVEGGREAWTDYECLWSSDNFSLIKCTLHSGRTHQIRVHLQALRCPLVGDRLYAPSRKSPFGEERVFLHSWHLGFKHPRTGEFMNFRQPLPMELAEYLTEIRKTM